MTECEMGRERTRFNDLSEEVAFQLSAFPSAEGADAAAGAASSLAELVMANGTGDGSTWTLGPVTVTAAPGALLVTLPNLFGSPGAPAELTVSVHVSKK